MEGRKMKKLLTKIIVKLASIVAGNEKQQIGQLDILTGKVTW
jgi:hypothetical protein